MGLGFFAGLLLLVLGVHLFLAFFASLEVADYPLFSTGQKVLWQSIVWLLPILGTLLAHKKLGLGWASDAAAGGHSSQGGGHGGGGGCDGGGGGC